MSEKLKTFIWFAQRPTTWAFALELASRVVRTSRDGPSFIDAAQQWAAAHATPVPEALAKLGLLQPGEAVPALPDPLLREGEQRAKQSARPMGGPGDLALLYAAVTLSNAERVVETGVAYGWSSLVILAALSGRENAKLVSVDMPYPKMNNEAYVGVVVPEGLRRGWDLIREPDRNGIRKAIARQGGPIDLCHYDSDKTWYGRQYGFPLLWKALRPGGVFISDDIQDNLAFAEFAEAKKARFAVTESNGKYVGIIVKPT